MRGVREEVDGPVRRYTSMHARRNASEINRGYDRRMYDDLVREMYGYSDFCNFGYWRGGTPDLKQASEQLMEVLLRFIPDREGRVLDVACGKGASSRYLGRVFGPRAVTGINISEKQLESCRENAPGSTFKLMD